MDARHLPERHGHAPGDECADHIGEHDGGPGDLHGGARPEEQARPNRSADGDHRHLSGGELPAQPGSRVSVNRGRLLVHLELERRLSALEPRSCQPPGTRFDQPPRLDPVRVSVTAPFHWAVA